jgi:hypothetical protein
LEAQNLPIDAAIEYVSVDWDWLQQMLAAERVLRRIQEGGRQLNRH